ncbi:acetylornithine deacetylase [Hoeflea poritis]|uniref:Acetylornithine deacetylase n=1 Tax=Hoeflea poritis TaxID=2993659 RepID=A0ABT4VKJ9_9HYPH|nr:acetylornithine deacetylase [Hoeflea poritis]MDA4845124.1 acetylornithine deacetylase [Hoeflea poritis]
MYDRAREFLDRLIQFDTVSRNSNLECVDWIQETLGAAASMALPIPHRIEPKSSLLLRFGPAEPGGIALSGHLDVVPVDGQKWSSDPFCLSERDGKLYGRGTCDMKGFVALAMALASEIDSARLVRPLWLVLTYDEEIGCLAAEEAATTLARQAGTPDIVVVGEPTSMQPVDRHKGISILRLRARGAAAHSSNPDLGAGTIVPVSRFVAAIADYFDERTHQQARGTNDDATTFNAGCLAGGNAVNIVPAETILDFEFREIDDDPDEILRDVRTLADIHIARDLRAAGIEAPVDLERIIWCPSLSPEHNAKATRVASKLSGNAVGDPVAFGTEAGFFQNAGFSAVVCGPGGIEQAHQPDENLSLEQFSIAARFMDALGEHLAR